MDLFDLNDDRNLDDVSGQLRIEHRDGIVFVVGEGKIFRIYDREEAESLIDELESVDAAIH